MNFMNISAIMLTCSSLSFSCMQFKDPFDQNFKDGCDSYANIQATASGSNTWGMSYTINVNAGGQQPSTGYTVVIKSFSNNDYSTGLLSTSSAINFSISSPATITVNDPPFVKPEDAGGGTETIYYAIEWRIPFASQISNSKLVVEKISGSHTIPALNPTVGAISGPGTVLTCE